MFRRMRALVAPDASQNRNARTDSRRFLFVGSRDNRESSLRTPTLLSPMGAISISAVERIDSFSRHCTTRRMVLASRVLSRTQIPEGMAERPLHRSMGVRSAMRLQTAVPKSRRARLRTPSRMGQGWQRARDEARLELALRQACA